jgi:hypothetical protein
MCLLRVSIYHRTFWLNGPGFSLRFQLSMDIVQSGTNFSQVLPMGKARN